MRFMALLPMRNEYQNSLEYSLNRMSVNNNTDNTNINDILMMLNMVDIYEVIRMYPKIIKQSLNYLVDMLSSTEDIIKVNDIIKSINC